MALLTAAPGSSIKCLLQLNTPYDRDGHCVLHISGEGEGNLNLRQIKFSIQYICKNICARKNIGKGCGNLRKFALRMHCAKRKVQPSNAILSCIFTADCILLLT